MTDQTLLRKLKGRVTADIYHLFEKRLGLGESSPAHGCGDAERRNDHKPTDLSHSSAVVEAEDGGKLNRLAGKWRKREAEYRKELKSIIESGNPEVAMRMEWAASVFKECASELESALGSDPRTRSDNGEDEVCVCSTEDPGFENQDGIKCCFLCAPKNSTLSQRKRSGLHNGKCDAAPKASESTNC